MFILTHKQPKARIIMDSNVNEKQILVSQFVNNGILDFNGLVNRPTDVKGFKIEDGKDLWLEALLLQYKDLYFEILMEYPISRLEFVYKAIFNNDMELFLSSGLAKDFEEILPTANLSAVLVHAKNIYGSDIPQNTIIPDDLSSAIDAFISIKTKLFNDWVKLIQNKIDSRRTAQKQDDLYQRIKNKLSKEHLLKEIDQGNVETAIVNACVRLESLLKNRYHYTGDLRSMIDHYIELNPTKKEWGHKLHKLRMKRNAIVHADDKSINFSTADLILCIDIIEKMG